jgi:hypothetical protein
MNALAAAEGSPLAVAGGDGDDASLLAAAAAPSIADDAVTAPAPSSSSDVKIDMALQAHIAQLENDLSEDADINDAALRLQGATDAPAKSASTKGAVARAKRAAAETQRKPAAKTEREIAAMRKELNSLATEVAHKKTSSKAAAPSRPRKTSTAAAMAHMRQELNAVKHELEQAEASPRHVLKNVRQILAGKLVQQQQLQHEAAKNDVPARTKYRCACRILDVRESR